MEVIIIEDNGVLGLVLSRRIALWGYSVQTICSERLVLNWLETLVAPPDCIILDLYLPARANGDRIMRQIRARFPDVPLILMSGWPHIEQTFTTPEVFLAKPFPLEQLQELLAAAADRTFDAVARTYAVARQGGQPDYAAQLAKILI